MNKEYESIMEKIVDEQFKSIEKEILKSFSVPGSMLLIENKETCGEISLKVRFIPPSKFFRGNLRGGV